MKTWVGRLLCAPLAVAVARGLCCQYLVEGGGRQVGCALSISSTTPAKPVRPWTVSVALGARGRGESRVWLSASPPVRATAGGQAHPHGLCCLGPASGRCHLHLRLPSQGEDL